jgi:Cof subfamily protein (haloacid dehalogenase superfamily)
LKTPVDLLALDVDGTLAAEGNRVTTPTVAALRRAAEAGIVLTLCTGRRYRSAHPILEAVGLPIHAVCLGGAMVKDPSGETLHSTCFSTDAFRKVAALIRGREQAVVAQCDRQGVDFAVDGSVSWNTETSRYHRLNQGYAEWRRGLHEEDREDVLVVGCFGEHAEMLSLREAIQSSFPHEFSVHVLRSVGPEAWYCEVLQRGVDKWTGLSGLADALSISHTSICAVGDELNDLAMVRAAGFGVAVGNAREELKRVADRVIGRNDEDGLVPLIEELISARAPG